MKIKNLFQRGSSFIGAGAKAFVPVPIFLIVLLVMVIQAHGKEEKIKVVASIFPAYDFARAIAGDRLELRQLLPPGVEAHGFSPTPMDIIRINQADLFLYTGPIMEPRVAKMLRSLDGDVQVVDLSVGLLSGEDSHHDHHGPDPHFWLDPCKAKIMVERLTQFLVQVDSDHGQEYKSRAEIYLGQLTSLDAEIHQGLQDCRQRTIVSGGHFAFGHFIERYNLQAVSAYPGFSSDSKPSPKRIMSLIKTMQTTGAMAVFHEELMDPKVAQVIVEETGARLLLLHGAHNVSKNEMESSVTYISIMQDNLSRLRLGLSCR